MFRLKLQLAALVAWTTAVASQENPFSSINAHGRVDFTALGRTLSSTAEIYLPGSDEFDAAVTRWSNLAAPVANVVVAPGTEDPRTSRTHCGRLENKQVGPALGGGHGWLQGHHGLIADQFVSMRVIKADGSLVTVDKNSDVFWAMKGVGHNFGIVTSVVSKIYDIKHRNYALETVIFSGDKVEAVYELANELWLTNGTMPDDLVNWSYWFFDPTIDPNKPVIAMYIIQEGVDTVNPAYAKPFHDLGPIIKQPTSGTYLDLAKLMGISLSDTPCQITGNANPRFPIYLKSYNPSAQRRVYDMFAEVTTSPCTPFSKSLFMFEGYGMQAVRAIPDHSTAVAYRSQNLLAAPLLTYTPNGKPLDEKARKLGNQIRRILHEGSGQTSLDAYVNYAYGDETPMDWYGADKRRQNRLRSLKRDFDPKGMFSFYAPIV